MKEDRKLSSNTPCKASAHILMTDWVDGQVYRHLGAGQERNLCVCGARLIATSKMYEHDWQNKRYLATKTSQRWQIAGGRWALSKTDSILRCAIQSGQFLVLWVKIWWWSESRFHSCSWLPLERFPTIALNQLFSSSIWFAQKKSDMFFHSVQRDTLLHRDIKCSWLFWLSFWLRYLFFSSREAAFFCSSLEVLSYTHHGTCCTVQKR